MLQWASYVKTSRLYMLAVASALTQSRRMLRCNNLRCAGCLQTSCEVHAVRGSHGKQDDINTNLRYK